jgi:hypothetical protein
MILRVTEDGTLELTEMALMVDVFAEYREKVPEDESIALFSVCHYMYHFDSHLLDIEDHSERLREARKFVHNGNLVKLTRTTHKVMAVYKELYELDMTSAYITMKNNFTKLRKYAEAIEFVPEVINVPEEDRVEGGPDKITKGTQVDYKEFQAVNSMIPKFQKELSEFKTRLMDEVKANIEAYGGGQLGAYE